MACHSINRFLLFQLQVSSYRSCKDHQLPTETEAAIGGGGAVQNKV
jgi:hypothetical protein